MVVNWETGVPSMDAPDLVQLIKIKFSPRPENRKEWSQFEIIYSGGIVNGVDARIGLASNGAVHEQINGCKII